MDSLARLVFCPPGHVHFDRPEAGDDATADFSGGITVPPTWRTTANDEWINLAPLGAELPTQGWKIHASATAANAGNVLEIVAKYCFAQDVVFKFLRSAAILQRRNSKYADRGSSGKFATIYPTSEEQLEQILIELGGLLDGEQGPYILSDLRWRSGPLYVRYGGILPVVVRGPHGRPMYCIQDPQGNLVEDRRGPGFRPPEWISLPKVLDEALAARNAGTLRDFPYRVTRALHFSNGGGVYRATTVPDGVEVLVREARPLAGLDASGQDAVARLHAEHLAMQRLSGVPGIPELIDFRVGHEHRYLIREFVEGQSLAKEMIRRNPLFAAQEPVAGADAFADYAQWALGTLDQIENTVRAMHSRGVVFNDLHPANVLIRSDGGVAFIDFETANAVDDAEPQVIGAPGFVAPAGYTGPAIDRYALGCLRLVVFAPLAAAVPWGRFKVDQLLDFATETFGLPDDFASMVLADLGPGFAEERTPAIAGADPTTDTGPVDWPTRWPSGTGLVERISAGIAAGATPERSDRLYPGDARQFAAPEGGLDLATGAAGVLWALDAVGAFVPQEHVDWLVAATKALRDPRPGLCDGIAGIAVVLDRLGRADVAAELVGTLIADTGTDPGLTSGRSGIGLALAGLAVRHGNRTALTRARQLADQLCAEPFEGPATGLLNGASGRALFLLRMHQVDGDPALLDGAVRALLADAELLETAHRRAFAAGEPGPSVSLGSGSAGLALVADELAGRLPAGADRAAVRAVAQRAEALTRRSFLPQAGLFEGCAGTAVTLSRLSGDEGGAATALRNVGLFSVEHGGRPAVLGAECLRLSADLSTGAAGVLLAVHAAEAGGVVPLPFFDLPFFDVSVQPPGGIR